MLKSSGRSTLLLRRGSACPDGDGLFLVHTTAHPGKSASLGGRCCRSRAETRGSRGPLFALFAQATDAPTTIPKIISAL